MAAGALAATAGGGSGVAMSERLSYAARIQRLEALRQCQDANERRMESALSEASGELLRLQRGNVRSVEAAEQELLTLTSNLQTSLRTQHELEQRSEDADAVVAELAERRAWLCSEQEFAQEALRAVTSDLRASESAVVTERAESCKILSLIERSHQNAQRLEMEAAAASSERVTLESEVASLRRCLQIEAEAQLGTAKAVTVCLSHLTRGEAAEQPEAKSSSTIADLEMNASRLQNAVARRTLPRALGALSNWAGQRRRVRSQLLMAHVFRRHRFLRRALAAFSIAVRALQLEQYSIARSRLTVAVVQLWHQEAAACQWARWIDGCVSRRYCSWVSRRVFLTWCAGVRVRLNLRRLGSQTLELWVLRRRRLAVGWWGSWSLSHRGARVFRRQRCCSFLLLCWRAWRRHAQLEEAHWTIHRRWGSFEKSLLLRASFDALLASLEKERKLRCLCCRAARRRDMFLFGLWRILVEPRRASRQVRRGRLSERLRRWTIWTQRARSTRCAEVAVLPFSDHRSAQSRQGAVKDWAALASLGRWHRLRASTITGRRRLDLYRWVWSAWVHLPRLSLRERGQQLFSELEAARSGQSVVSEELEEVSGRRSSAELARLQLLDELHSVSAETAEMVVEHDELRETGEALQHATSEQRYATEELEKEAAALRAEVDEWEDREGARRLGRELQLREALEAPAALRAQLSLSEASVRQAASEERERRDEVATIGRELDKLQRSAAAQLGEKEARVSLQRAEVERSRKRVQDLEVELTHRWRVLGAHELQIKGGRRWYADRNDQPGGRLGSDYLSSSHRGGARLRGNSYESGSRVR